MPFGDCGNQRWNRRHSRPLHNVASRETRLCIRRYILRQRSTRPAISVAELIEGETARRRARAQLADAGRLRAHRRSARDKRFADPGGNRAKARSCLARDAPASRSPSSTSEEIAMSWPKESRRSARSNARLAKLFAQCRRARTESARRAEG